MISLIYTVLFISGFAGLLVMAAMGFMHAAGHHGHHGHGHGNAHGHAGHGHVDAHAHGHAAHGHGHTAHGHAHAAHGHHAGHGHGHDNANADGDGDGDADVGVGPSVLMRLMPFLSPLNWFSWFLGGGAAGMLCNLGHVPEPYTAGAAVLGAIGFNQGVVKPVWNLIFGFASKPAGNLEACLAQVVEAATGFNERGEGLVRVSIDGRSEDVLAQLTLPAQASGERVRRGDKLLIEEVDPHTNTCRVSRM